MKKVSLSVLFLALVLALTMSLGACADNTKKLEITASSTTILEGKTTTLTAKSDSSEKIEWSVSDETILKIDKTIGKICTVSALKPGKADVIAKQGENEAKYTLTVTALADQPRVEISHNGNVVTEKLTVKQDATLQLTAQTVNTDSKVSSWTSSNPEKATVSETGLVTGVLPGTVTITAAVNSSLFADIEVEVLPKEGSVYYDLKCGEEDGTKAYNNETQAFDGVDIKEDEFFFWMARAGWSMQDVVLDYAYYQDGKINIKYTSDWDPGYWYGFQIFNKKSDQEVGKYYKLNCKINVNVDCTVTLNGTPVELKAGDNNVEVFYQLNAGLGAEGTSSFDLALGYNDGSATGMFLKDGTVVISDIAWEEITSFTTLQAPSFTLNNEGVITITDPNTEGVGSYNLGFFQGDENKGSIEVKNGEKIDTSTIEKGTYTVKIQAMAKDIRYRNSEFSTTGVNYEVAAAASYALPNTSEGGAVATPGRWTYWCESWVKIADNNYSDGVVKIGFSNNAGNWYDMQLFYKSPENVAGKVYKMSFDLEMDETANGRVTLSGNVITLKGGKNHYDVVITEQEGKASFAMIFGLNGESNKQEIQAATVIISNLKFEEVQATALTAPTFTIGENNVITITDTNEAQNVAGYVLGFFKNDELSCQVAVENGKAIDLSNVAKGTYTVKLLAKGASAMYLDSEWSSTTATVESTTEITIVDNLELPANTELVKGAEADGPNDKLIYWYVEDASWNCGSVVTINKAEYKNGVVTLSYVGGSVDFSVQLFYKSTMLAPGKYKLTLNINATAAGKCKVNGKVVDLVAGDNQVVAEYTVGNGSALSIQFNGSETAVTYALSNVKWEADTSTDPGPVDPGKPTESFVLPADANFVKNGENEGPNDTLKYWYVEDASWNCGSVVTMNKAEYKEGKVTLSYVGGDKDFSVQLFYKSTALAQGTYKLTLNINASAAGKCKVNGKVVDLVAGDNQVEVEFTTGGEISALDIQFYGSQTEVTYVISNVKWEGVTSTDPTL